MAAGLHDDDPYGDGRFVLRLRAVRAALVRLLSAIQTGRRHFSRRKLHLHQRSEMSLWLDCEEVLVGKGSAEPVPPSPRLRAHPVSSPRSRWPPHRQQQQQAPLSSQQELMGKAKELFELCDKEGKGFITKRDMQRLEGEVPLSPEQLETVFESLDREGNGFLTPLEFNTGLGELVALQETEDEACELDEDDSERRRLFRSHAELCSLWCELEKDSPALLSLLEEVLAQALSHLQDTIKDRDSLEQALHRREAEHEQMIRSLYEEMETQMREEREKHTAEDSIKQKQKNQHLEEQLEIRKQELELSLSKQKEMESRMRQMSRSAAERPTADADCTETAQPPAGASGAGQSRAGHSEQAEEYSEGLKKHAEEKDSLMRQLELLRDMNKRLRDEKDARLETQRRHIHRQTFVAPVPVTRYMIYPASPVGGSASRCLVWGAVKSGAVSSHTGRGNLQNSEATVEFPALWSHWILQSQVRMEARAEKSNSCGTICLKYLLFLFNISFVLAGGALLAVGVWTLVEKSDYISLLSSSLYSASAYLLIVAGVILIFTGLLGCCATLKEIKSLLIVYLVLLLSLFLMEIIAGILAFINYHELDEELQQNLKQTMQQKYHQPGQDSVTQAVDRLQQEFKCCGSNSSADWADSLWIQDRSNQRLVPDSCCKTPGELCGRRDHPSNIYRLEGGCIQKLELFILSQLQILGALSIGIACLQLLGMLFTCCLYKSLKRIHTDILMGCD
ncbi:hypothetical protein WMY93_032244 [Mugilogobius chulae]|uniref:EF-hand domain-containing protein n=1 Tax=Mugilogobius chulae TaxID=88201 RepID=A0AAW0MJ31_9GOBI